MKRYHKPSRFLVILLFIFFSGLTGAQDVQFSLFRLNPMYLNAAQTGVFEGNWRFSANFRNQWVGTSTPFRSATAGFDSKIHLADQAIGYGLLFLNDESGIGGLTVNKVYGSIAYQMKISDSYIRLGVQPGYVFASFNSWYNWDHETGTFTAPSNEPGFGESTNYFDINAGISWQGSFNKIIAEAGISVLHINQPNISFFEGDAPQDMVILAHGGVQIDLNEKVFLYPQFMLTSGSGTSLTALGSEIGFRTKGRSQVKNLFMAVYLRNGLLDELSTLSVAAGIRMNRLDFAIDYDLNIGNYSNSAGSMGAFEIALIYRSITTILNSYSIPCERL
ncbi:MAG: PorP/SprF family type IX secretion system membrane protein [Bacteroidales bacterium]|nr:PorP/SprF family type IX secretion system membrane protein [Bacteroidales bacterium]